MIFFPPVSLFFSPLDHAIIVLLYSVIGGKYGKREIKSYNIYGNKIMGKNAVNRGHNIIFFPLLF